MTTIPVKPDWYIVRLQGLTFFGRARKEVETRALNYLMRKGAANEPEPNHPDQ